MACDDAASTVQTVSRVYYYLYNILTVCLEIVYPKWVIAVVVLSVPIHSTAQPSEVQVERVTLPLHLFR
jgi:hypothetical protein